MQDRFVGDIGDFGKYGLLRALTGIHPEAEPRLSLGVVWYHNEEETGSPGDGQRTSYLHKPAEYEDCDPALFRDLHRIVAEGKRSLDTIEQSGILSRDTVFSPKFAPLLSAIIFLDPDKGLAFSPKQRSKEHVYVRDLESQIAPSQTVVIYQSFGRQLGDIHDKQMARWTDHLQHQLPLREAPRVLRFRPWHPRAFIVLPSAAHAATIDARLDTLLDSPWERHFTRFQPS